MKNPNDEIVQLGQAHEDSKHDTINDNIDDLKKNIKSLTRNIFDYSNDQMNEWSNKAWRSPWAKLFENEDDDLGDVFRKLTWEFPSVYQAHTGEKCSNRTSFGRFAGGKSAFGLYAWKAPSVRAYNECVTKKGESVWDDTGYWRCLFPNSEFTNEQLEYKRQKLADQILTKEDFEQELASTGLSRDERKYDFGSKGVFFKQFEDFMNWKSIMYENVRRERRRQRDELRSRWQRDQQQKAAAPGTDAKEVVSSVFKSFLDSDADKSETVYKEVRTEYFADGTSATKTVTKTRPMGSDAWTSVEENYTNEPKPKSGWFWNTKD